MELPEHLEIRSRLGEGGMGVVYEAFDRERGELVALKVVTQLAADAALRFRREFGAMARLRHPNIVQVYDYWEDERGHPGYTMEIVRGGDLSGLLERLRAAAGTDLDWSAAVEAILKLLRPLETLHRAGLVHRDLKPANALLTEDGIVKLTDFGLIVSSGSLGTRGKIAGTPAYMAPEQILGAEADRRADIYSVGVMLFEFLTGKRPFDPPDVIELLRQHLNCAPPVPSSVRPGLPAALDAIVLKALAKMPAERWRSAEELADALAGLLGETEAGHGAVGPARRETGASWRLFRPTLAGRREQLESIADAVRGLGGGSSTVLIVHGGFGLGKSRLLEEAEASLRIAGHQALRHSCAAGAEEAYAAARAILGQLRSALPDADAEDAELEPLWNLLRQESADAPRSEAARDPFPGIAAAAWLLIERLARAGPLGLLLDDLHEADEASRRLFAHVAQRMLAEGPVSGAPGGVLLVLALDADDERSAKLAATLAVFPRCQNLQLEPIGQEDIETLLRSMLTSEELPAGLASNVQEASAGHVGFAESYARWLADSGFLRFDLRWRFEAPWSGTGAVEVGREVFRSILQAQLPKLGRGERRLLDALAIAGGKAPYWLLEHMFEGDASEMLLAQDGTVRRGLVRELEAERLALFHPSAAGALKDAAPVAEREGLERLALEGLLARRKDLAPAEAGILASLAVRAGRLEVAAELYLMLGIRAARLHDNGLAREHLEQACAAASGLGMARTESLEITPELELGALLLRLGELGPARRWLEAAFESSQRARRRDLHARALDRLGLLALREGDLSGALEHFENSRREAELAQDTLRLAVVEANVGEAHFAAGRLDEALLGFQRAAELFGDLGDLQNRAYALNNLGAANERLGRLEMAAAQHAEALAAFRTSGDRHGEAMSLGNLGVARHRLGQRAEALESLRASLELRQELGDKAGAAVVLQNVGFVELARERLRPAVEALGKALELHRLLGNGLGEAGCLCSLSAALLGLGRVGDAREAAGRGLAIFESKGSEAGIPIARWRLADVQLARGKLGRALRDYRAAARSLIALRNASAAAWVWLGMGRCLLYLGRSRESRDVLRRAFAEFEGIGQPAGAAEACEALVVLEARTGRLRTAMHWLERACECGRKASSRAVLARTEGLRGCLFARAAKLPEAVRCLRRAIRQLRALDRAGDAYVELERLGRVLFGIDEGEALQIFEKLRTRAGRLGLPLLQMRGEIGVALSLGRAGAEAMAVEMLERGAARSRACEDRWLRRDALLAESYCRQALGEEEAARVCELEADRAVPGAPAGMQAGP